MSVCSNVTCKAWSGIELGFSDNRLSFTGLIRIEEKLRSVIVDKGEKARFVCKIVTQPSDSDRIHLHWKHNGKLINKSNHAKYVLKTDKNRNTLVIRNVNQNDSGVYMCIVSVGIDMDMSSAHLTVRSVPDPPVNVRLNTCHGHSAEITWQPGPNNGDPISKYIVQFNTSENKDHWFDYFEKFPGDMNNVFVEMSPWGTYSFRVIAKNSVGQSKPSESTVGNCTTPPDRPDGNPKSVRTRTDKKGMLVIQWEPMHRLLHHGPAFCYHVYWRPKGSTYWESAVVADPSVSHFEKEVDDIYGLYEIQVKAENNLGASYQPAFIYHGHSGEGEPLISPKDFRVDPTYSVEPHIAHFIWEAVDTTEDKIRGHFRGYQLRYWRSSEGRFKMKKIDISFDLKEGDHGPDVRVALSNLPAYTALRAQVTVRNTHYTGPPSQTIDFFTPEGEPGPVRNLHTEAYGMTYVVLKWLPPDEPNGILIGYGISYQTGKKLGKIRALKTQITNPSKLGARITGLVADKQYRFYVWARTEAGKGESSYLDIKTADGKGARNYYRSENGQLESAYYHETSGCSRNIVFISSYVISVTLTFYFVFHH
ncbi:hypothetical protein LOTGIDRAFT_153779 [Lottia gigantea]|uniref:Uncharacterized protein n=1 Tax=Lottia gigantea TaxID=225164 RepID=V3ZJB0_LOTGI|nr:hypothetical protein LOTGIDRAFT_153779 [Lottia gigantea]ESO91343.1 hypothetical protein LOTGIDRAFT_153779 [Lottia gigantea]